MTDMESGALASAAGRIYTKRIASERANHRISKRVGIMQEPIRQIAERIKVLREIAGITAEDLAKTLDVPVATVLQYEQGEVDIPIGFLYQLAGFYKVEMDALLTGGNPKLHMFSVVRKEKAPSVERRKQYRYQALAANFVHKKAEPFLVTVEPRSETAPLQHNSHPGQEFDYVLEGTLQITIDGHDLVLNTGDSVFFDSGYEHGMRALENRTARFLAVIL